MFSRIETDALDALHWAPVQHVMKDHKHGRDEARTIQVLPAPDSLFPNLVQALLIERHVADLRGNPKSDIPLRWISLAQTLAATPWRPSHSTSPVTWGSRTNRMMSTMAKTHLASAPVRVESNETQVSAVS